MRHFNDIDPLTVAQDPRVVASIQDDKEPTITYYLLVDGEHLILATADYFTNKRTGESKWLHYQIEFPKRGLQWYLDTLEHKFFKTEAEGGLPRGKFHDIAEIDGERLSIGRAFDADGKGGAGYYFATLDRKEDDLAKKYTFTDAFLFEGGLIQIFEDIAAKIKGGQL